MKENLIFVKIGHLSIEERFQIFEWCKEHFGPHKIRWDIYKNIFYFRSKSDAVLFKLMYG